MATTAHGLADFTDALETVVAPYIQDNLPQDTILLSNLKRNDNVEYFNDNFYAPIRVGRHSGIVNLPNEKAKLRTGNATLDRANVGVKIATGVYDIGDVVKKATENKKGAVEADMMFQARTLRADYARNINRQYFGDGVGVLGQVSGSVGAGTLSVMYPNSSLDDGRSIDWYGTINADLKPAKYLTAGQAIGIGTAAADVGTITAITGATNSDLATVVVTGAPAIVANDSIYLVDGDETGAGTSEIQGVRLALSSGTADYAGVPRSLSVWQAQVFGTAGNTALTLSGMEDTYLAAVEYALPGDRYAWFMNKSLYRKYGDILTAMRKTVNSIKLVGGWDGIEFELGKGKVGVFLDYDVPDGEAILINLDTWTVCQVADMGFIDQGRMDRRTDYLTYQNVWTWYTNLICVCPAANGREVRRTK